MAEIFNELDIFKRSRGKAEEYKNADDDILKFLQTSDLKNKWYGTTELIEIIQLGMRQYSFDFRSENPKKDEAVIKHRVAQNYGKYSKDKIAAVLISLAKTNKIKSRVKGSGGGVEYNIE